MMLEVVLLMDFWCLNQEDYECCFLNSIIIEKRQAKLENIEFFFIKDKELRRNSKGTGLIKGFKVVTSIQEIGLCCRPKINESKHDL